MESQPKNPEFRIIPENFHPWNSSKTCAPALFMLFKKQSSKDVQQKQNSDVNLVV